MFDKEIVFSCIEHECHINKDKVVYVGKPRKEFFKEYILKYDNDFYEPLSSRIDIDSFVEKVHTLSTTFVLVYKGEVVGLIASYFYDISSEKGFITLVHTKHKFRGQHLSIDLVETAQAYAKSINFKYIDLMVYKDNASAYNLYSKYGFKVISEENGRCAMRWTANKE